MLRLVQEKMLQLVENTETARAAQGIPSRLLPGQLREAMLQRGNGSVGVKTQITVMGREICSWLLMLKRSQTADFCRSFFFFLPSSLSQGKLSFATQTSPVQGGCCGELCSDLTVAFPACVCSVRAKRGRDGYVALTVPDEGTLGCRAMLSCMKPLHLYV